MTEKALELVSPVRPPASAAMQRVQRSWSLMPSTLGEAMEIGKMIAASDFAPKDYVGKPGNVIIAIQMGADLGLQPMQALQNIAVINGRPSVYGDAALAIVQAAGVLERFVESFEGERGTDQFKAVCIAKRLGMPDEVKRTFSVADAKKANLWNKKGPWETYPDRMLQFRARGFTLRDVAADKLMGLILAEEAMDYPNAIEGHVVASVPANILERLPEAVRDHIEKAFETLALAPGLRVAKINEFLAGDGVDLELAANELLTWCRNEYAKRKTGQGVAPKDDTNGKPKAPSGGTVASSASSAGPLAEPLEKTAVDPKRGESDGSSPAERSVGDVAGKSPTPSTKAMPTAAEVFGKRGDLF